MRTDIPILDLLLGPTDSLAPRTQAMLIRGAPGSGKTTLALEILARQISKKEFPAFGIFLSLEVKPRDAWISVYRRLSPELKARFPNLEENLEEEKDDRAVLALTSPNIHLRLAGRRWLDAAIPYGDWHTVEKRLKDEIAALAVSSSPVSKQGLIVLDTVNLLGDIVQQKLYSPTHAVDMRAVI
jgi:hypothetical protein